MKILHVARLTENKANGINVVVPMHVKAQAKIADAALVNYQNIDIADVKQFRYEGSQNFPSYLPEPFDKPDLVVFHGVNLIENIKVYKNLLRLHIPYVIVPHGELSGQALRKKWLKKKIAYFLWFNAFLKNAATIQCLSQREAEASTIVKNKIVVPNGMELHQKKETIPTDIGMRLLYIGRLEWSIKGLDLLIKAVSNIQDFMRENQIVLHLYGPGFGNQCEQIKGFIQKGNVSDLVQLKGAVFDREKEAAYKSYDIFIQTSRSEGMPMGILEAMSYGMPIIATQGTSLMEQVVDNDCGYAAGKSDQSIAEAIRQAYLTKDSWAEKGSNAWLFIKNKYSWTQIAELSIEKYYDVVKH